MGEEEIGYCQVASQVVRSTKAECDEIGGNWTEEAPEVCVVATTALGAGKHASVTDVRRLRDLIVERDATAAELWATYHPSYLELAAPIVALMQRDPVVRRLVAAFAVEPAVQFLRTAAIHSDPGSDDAAVRSSVHQGVQRLTEHLMTLDDERGDDLTHAVFTSLRDVWGHGGEHLAITEKEF